MTWSVALFLSVATLLAGGLVGAIVAMLALRAIGTGIDLVRQQWRGVRR